MESHSRVEVLTGILLVARSGTTKTKIMSGSSLTPSQVEQCLCFLQQSDLLRKEEGSEVFRLTRKGASLIGDYERIDQRIEGRLVRPLTV
jgi:predicted transcriptional regulator